MKLINTEADVAEGLACLLESDPRLRAISAAAGPLPLRRRSGGFEGLAAVVTAQQISTDVATAIWARLVSAVQPFTAARLLATSEDALRAAGLSRSKIATLYGVAGALMDGYDLDGLDRLPAGDAIAAMVALKGIGPWTAESYLLFCVGHPDVFPAGDLALQIAAQHGLGLPERPTDKELRQVAEAWSPWRAVAARLFWAYYKARRTERRAVAATLQPPPARTRSRRRAPS